MGTRKDEEEKAVRTLICLQGYQEVVYLLKFGNLNLFKWRHHPALVTSETNYCRVDTALVHLLGTPLGGRGMGTGKHSQECWEIFDTNLRCSEMW